MVSLLQCFIVAGGLLSGVPNGLDLDLAIESRAKCVVPADDIIEKYKEALSYYSKVRNSCP